MSWTQWLIFILVIQVIHGLGTWKLYVKAGRKAWEAFVPVYNGVVLMKIINRPWWYVILLFVPIVNLIMFPVIWVETARSFGKNTYLDTFLAVISLGFYNYYLNYVTDVEHVKDRSIMPKSSSGDWVSSILFAIVAATLVHTYFMQPYTIPTSSLEKTLLVGDFLFVSKFHYGARTPMTAVAAPMVHDTIPLLNKKSYLYNDKKEEDSWLNKLQLPYFRLPGFQKIKRNDIVVFNWPVDTIDIMYTTPDRAYYKPVDKRTNYVKRCVGIPGDSFELRNGYVYINGKQNELPDRARLQFFYTLETNSPLSQNVLDKYKITESTNVYSLPTKVWENEKIQNYLDGKKVSLNIISRDSIQVDVAGSMTQEVYQQLKFNVSNTKINVNITDDLVDIIKNDSRVKSLKKYGATEGRRDLGIFPKDPSYNWNNDFFGPLYIPEEGKTIDLNLEVLPLYQKIITDYEGNDLKVNGNQILLNGEVANNYTFKQNYYWMMGDNRHNSLDARAWGFVPFNHVVGKPVFVWMSWDGIKNPRWKRFFTTVGGSGETTSYLIPFLVLLLGYFGFSKWRKRRKNG